MGNIRSNITDKVVDAEKKSMTRVGFLQAVTYLIGGCVALLMLPLFFWGDNNFGGLWDVIWAVFFLVVAIFAYISPICFVIIVRKKKSKTTQFICSILKGTIMIFVVIVGVFAVSLLAAFGAQGFRALLDVGRILYFAHVPILIILTIADFVSVIRLKKQKKKEVHDLIE